MIKSFRDKGTEDLFDGRATKQARNRLEKLNGEREGQYSIRINDQGRVCFQWTESGAENVEIVDYH